MKTALILAVLYETDSIPLERVAKEYFSHSRDKMQHWARQQKYPFPVFRSGGQKSEWRVSVDEFGSYLDRIKAEAASRHQALNR